MSRVRWSFSTTSSGRTTIRLRWRRWTYDLARFNWRRWLR